jgi:hypothetical protein
MPQFWKIDALQWINPEHIVHVVDAPHVEPPTVRVKMAAEEPTVQGSGLEPYTLALTGEARERLLAYLTRDAAPDVSLGLLTTVKPPALRGRYDLS